MAPAAAISSSSPRGTLSLPTPSEIDGTLAPYLSTSIASDNDSRNNQWRSLVLQVLAYGTDYDVAAPPSPASASGGEGSARGRSTSPVNLPDRPGKPLVIRQIEAAQCLVGALGRFVDKLDKKDGGDDGGDEQHQQGIIDAALLGPREVLTDSLWLVGTILEPEAPTAGRQKGQAAPPPPSNIRFDALSALLNSISYGTSLTLPNDGSSTTDTSSTSVIVPAVPITTLQRRLEPSLLASANLLPNQSTKILVKRYTTANTNAYYRQVRFNLLQEESEGWSKLLGLLGGLPGNISSDNAGGDDAQVRVRELIGAFDLDPNRVLDVVVDMIESELTALLDANNGKGTGDKRSISELMLDAPNHASSVQILVQIAGGLKVDSLPHLLGFKYANYARKDKLYDAAAAGGGDAVVGPTPKTLHLTTAVLTLHGLVDPAKLVGHLSPSLNKLQAQYENYQDAYIKNIKRMGSVSLNAAAAASEEKKDDSGAGSAAAGGGASTSSSGAAASAENNQIIGLFHALVEAGAPWDVATSIFASASTTDDNEFNGAEAVSSLYEPVGRAVCAWVKRSISPAYDEKVGNVGKDLLRPMSQKKGGQKQKSGSTRPSGGKFSLVPSSMTAKTTLPVSTSLEGLSSTLAAPLSTMIASGAIRQDPVLYCMLCRLIKVLVPEEDIDETTYTLLCTFLVPCMSLFPSNPSVSTELWSVLSKLPYQIRYGLYGSSRLAGLEKGATRTTPRRKALPIIEAEVQTGIEARYSLKRLSKDNIKDMGRQLSKISHSNPIVVFTTILNQIESYDNLIQMMVDTFIHVTELSLDALGYCLLVALGGGDSKGGRSKLKEDGVNAAQWLSSLETFAGAFYKKFPAVEMHGLLSYLVRRLEQGETLELGVLRILLKTAGSYGFADCESTAGLSEVQLDGRAGSQLLKRETSDFGIVEKFNRKASLKLRSVLQNCDVGAVILILLSQIRSRILYHTDKTTPKHIKLIGSRYDSCQMVLSVLLDFLTDTTEDQTTSSGSIYYFASSLPELSELHQKFGLEPAISWMLCRPLIRAAMFEQEEKEAIPSHLEPYLPHTESMRTTSAAMLPEACWKYLTQDLFEMFYSHSLYDIHCPETRYKTEIVRLDKDKERLNQLKKGGDAARGMMASMAAAAAAAGGTEREVRQATAFTKEHEKDLERLNRHSGILSADLKRQKKHCDAVYKTFESKKSSFLSELKDEDVQKLTAETFLTYCVYPRCLLTPEDALYCAEFVMLLHKMEVPGFFTLTYVDRLINAIVGAVYSTTEDEAGNLSVLLKSTWAWLKNWRDDKTLFEKEVTGKPGSKMDDGEGGLKELSYDDFKKLYNKWHAILGQTFLGCLASKEYIHTRAGLILLSRVVNVFPTRPVLGEKIMDALIPLKDDVKRQDLRSMALGYSSQLIKARDEGVWEEDSAAAKARREKKEKEAEERKKNAEKQFQQMQKESEAIDRQLSGGGGGGGGRGPRDWDDRARSAPRGGGLPHGGGQMKSPLNPSAPKFTPAGGGQARELRGSDHSGRDSRGHSGRSSRERDDHHRHPEPRGRGPDDRGQLEGRWERGDRQGGRDMRKRSRSPGREMDRREEDAKRMRSQPPPPRGRGGPDFRSASPSRGGRRGDHPPLPPSDRNRRRSR